MTYERFRKTKANGSPILCKFCHKPVWIDTATNRVIETDGATLHVGNCPRRQAYYHEQALDSAEVRRRKSHE